MDNIKIWLDFEWIDEICKKIWALVISKTINDSIKKSIFYLERELKLTTPVDTWLLRNSYETEFTELEWNIRNFREYWIYVEWRKGFVQSVFDKSSEHIKQIFEWDIQKLINSITT